MKSDESSRRISFFSRARVREGSRTRWKPWHGLLLLLLSGPALANDPEPAKKAVERVARAFARLDGYAVTATVRGGEARGAEHSLGALVVDQRFDARVSGRVCRVTDAHGHEAYRLRLAEGGAIADGARWMSILATDEGRLLERVFARPEELLVECVKLKRGARWVRPAQVAPSFVPGADEDEPAAGTRERDEEATAEGDAPASNHVRIVAAGPVAVERFTTLVASGCFGGGWGIPETLSRADRTQLRIIYDLRLDPANERLERLTVTLLCASRDRDGRVAKGEAAFEGDCLAFTLDYVFTRHDAVDPIRVPADAQRLLRGS